MTQTIITLTQLLENLAVVRQQMEILEAKKQELESLIAPLAKQQVLANREQIGKKDTHTLYRTDQYQFVYQERLDKKKLNSHQDVESVNHDIQMEREEAERLNAEAIATAKKSLDEASAKINKLSQTEQGRLYEAEREEIIKKLTPQFMTPVIVFKS